MKKMNVFASLIAVVTTASVVSVTATAVTENVDHFCETYAKCTENFLAAARTIEKDIPGSTWGEIPLPVEATGETTMTIPYLIIPSTDEPKKLVIIDSGVHGIEGFAGSTLQHALLEGPIHKVDRTHTRFIFLHGVNAWGFANQRRVTRNNVDLNRNCTEDRGTSAEALERYQRYSSFLQPEDPASTGWWSSIGDWIQALWLVARDGTADVRQVVVEGQYHQPQGLFFGGSDFEPHYYILKEFLAHHTAAVDDILGISLHTGYGPRGVLNFFGSSSGTSCTSDALATIYQGYPLVSGRDQDFYYTRGDIGFVLAQTLQPHQCLAPVAWEYGTVDDSSLAAVSTLLTMIRENQMHQQGAESDNDRENISHDFRELFYPSAPEWRHKVLDTTLQVFPKIIERFQL